VEANVGFLRISFGINLLQSKDLIKFVLQF
jgi:hypothetical protein